MFPDNWPATLLSLLFLFVVGFALRRFKGTEAPYENDTLDYDIGGDPELTKTEPRSEQFGISPNHPHRLN
jgi:hypothetical protein